MTGLGSSPRSGSRTKYLFSPPGCAGSGSSCRRRCPRCGHPRLPRTRHPVLCRYPAARPGNDWGPRLSLAVGNNETHWPVLRLGYGMYYGRTENATVEMALTQTGSANGDQNFFIRPTDGYNSFTGTSGAPPFPDVLTGPPGSLVAPGVVEFAPRFRNPEVHQARPPWRRTCLATWR